MHKVSWLALRQVQAIRESVAFTLKGGAVDYGSGKPDQFFVDWLATQGVEPCFLRYMPEERLELGMLQTIEQDVAKHGIDLIKISMAGNYVRFDEPDLGTERSSTGWERLPNFITSSGLIRILGAMEQFELDVLKALLYYRPSGKNLRIHLDPVEIDISVVSEQPDSDGRYSKPALWSWLKKSAENAIERRKIYKSVFDIECFPPKFGTLKPTSIRAYYQELYEQRNALAHGRSLIEFSLADYCKAEAFVLSLVDHLSTVCAEKYKLEV